HTRKDEPFDYAPHWGKRFKDGMGRFAAEHTKMEFLFTWLDGEADLGTVWTNLFKPIADAETAEHEKMFAAEQRMKLIFGKYPTGLQDPRFWTRRIFVPEIGKSFTRGSLISVGLHLGNEYNLDVLKRGEKWSDPQLAAVKAQLEDRDWQTINELWVWFDEYWPDVAKLMKDLTGVVPAKVQATPFLSPTGRNMRGGYMPLRYDGGRSERQLTFDESKSVQELYGGHYARVMTRDGHTKERTDSGGKPIYLDLAVVTEHVTNVIHDLTHRRALLDVDKLTQDKEVADAIIETAGRQMYRQIRPWLRNVASDYRQPMNHWEAILNHVRGGASVVNMGYKVTTAIVQWLGYSQTYQLLGAKYSAIGLRKFYADGVPYEGQQRAKDFVFERSWYMRRRMRTFDRDMRDQMKHLGQVTNVRKSFFFMIGFMDMGVALPTWLGAYQKVMDGDVEGVEAGNEHLAIDFADGMVRRSQGSGSPKDLAQIQTGHPLMKLFTLFYSYFGNLYNLFQRLGKMTKSVKDVPAFASAMITLWFLPAILAELIAGRGPDDDEDWDEWFKRTAYIWGLYPLSSVIGIRDVANAMGPYGYDASAAFEAFSSLGRTAQIPIKLIDPDEEVSRADVRALVLTAGYFTKTPAKQVWITGEYMFDVMTNEEDPETVTEAVRNLAYARRR
ncbi:hypothetical protein LCGC14_2045480, partial [marine sediment metagenome]